MNVEFNPYFMETVAKGSGFFSAGIRYYPIIANNIPLFQRSNLFAEQPCSHPG